MKSIEIDRSKRLKEEPEKGHNRWHPDVSPVVAADPGEEVVLETRDASDCQMKPTVTVEDFDSFDAKVAHPLTGPVYINGAEPGDLLEIEYVDILPESYGWTRNRPGAGFLRDLFTEPYAVHWEIKDGWATSDGLPGVRIPNGSFMGRPGSLPPGNRWRLGPGARPTWCGAAGRRCRPTPRTPSPPKDRWPARVSGPSRHERTAATSTRSN